MKQGEIWLVNFMPQIGSEITKQRPAVIVSSDAICHLPTRIVVPFRDRKAHHGGQLFFVGIQPTLANGLAKESTADCSQVKSFDTQRFTRRLGVISASELQEIIDAVAVCLEA